MSDPTWATLVRHAPPVSDASPGEPCAKLIGREDDGSVAAWAQTEGCMPREHYHRLSAELHYVIAGEGRIRLDGRWHALAAGSIVHVPPGVVHCSEGAMQLLVVGVPFIAEEDTYYLDAA